MLYIYIAYKYMHLDLGMLKVSCAEKSHLASEEAYVAPSIFFRFGNSSTS